MTKWASYDYDDVNNYGSNDDKYHNSLPFLATLSITALNQKKMVIDQYWFQITITPVRTNISSSLQIKADFSFDVTWKTNIDALTSDSNLHKHIKKMIKDQTGCVVQENIDYTISLATIKDHETKQIVEDTKLLVTIKSIKHSKIYGKYSFGITAKLIISDINKIIKQKKLALIYSDEYDIFSKKSSFKSNFNKKSDSINIKILLLKVIVIMK